MKKIVAAGGRDKTQVVSCKSCGGDMPLLRKTLYGYSKCVKCSDVKAYGCVEISNHKTGNEIQILPSDLAERINVLAKRQGYGVMNGLKFNN